MISVKGPMPELRELASRIEKLTGEAQRSVLTQRLAEEARTQALLGFEQSRDPYGEPWKPVARGGQPLLDTGRLHNSLRPVSSPNGFTISTNVKYAATHQYGATIKAKRPGIIGRALGRKGKPLTFKVGPPGKQVWRSKYEVKIPRRQFMPEGRLGPIWTAAIFKVADATVREFMGPTRGPLK